MKNKLMKSMGVMIAAMMWVDGGQAQAQTIPGGRPEDATMAATKPDEYAWQLFLALNRQALPGTRGVIDANKPFKTYDPDKAVVWETWARGSGGRAGEYFPPVNYSEVYLDHGAAPPPWSSLPTPGLKAVDNPATLTFARKGTAEGSASLIDPGLSTPSGKGFESLMNQATYETIRSLRLYNIEGLEAAYTRELNGGAPIDFPASAQEVKAMWVRIKETDKPRYHWRTLRHPDGRTEVWGLTGLHIITRDLDNWFWSDFEHVDYLKLPVHELGLGAGEEAAELASQDVTTRGPNATAKAYDAAGKPLEGVRRETYGSKWQNYRLRGTQISYVNAKGEYTLLANTQLERGFQQTSSCMTCHVRATIGMRARNPDGTLPRLPNTLVDMIELSPILVGPVGNPDPNWFLDGFGRKKYAKTHFLWSMPYRAQSIYW